MLIETSVNKVNSSMSKLVDLETYPVKNVLSRLLQDKTTRKNIIFATDAYTEKGRGFSAKDPITVFKLLGEAGVPIKPRVEKTYEQQIARTREKAEVFTPSWIVNKMNNHCDEEWFGRSDVFNKEDGTRWTTTEGPIAFETDQDWKKYVDSRRIEITCGEAPYVVSRYDASTGEIIPIKDRIGILDRKLRVVNDNAIDDEEWLKWTQRAFESVYGYEFQGDNLLIARINVLNTFVDYYEQRFETQPAVTLLRKLATIICWNFWQMDGITGTIPYCVPIEELEVEQLCMSEFFDNVIEVDGPQKASVCKIRDWRKCNSVTFFAVGGGKR